LLNPPLVDLAGQIKLERLGDFVRENIFDLLGSRGSSELSDSQDFGGWDYGKTRLGSDFLICVHLNSFLGGFLIVGRRPRKLSFGLAALLNGDGQRLWIKLLYMGPRRAIDQQTQEFGAAVMAA
jgi:hypothetical protein